MRHIRPISQTPRFAAVSALEQIVLLIFQIYFSSWDNFSAVYNNLQKFYTKTSD